MASTAEGNALTDDYRRRQAQLAAVMVAKLGQAWPILAGDLDGKRNEWLRTVAALVAQGHTASATLAAAYLPALRALERVPGKGPTVPIGTVDLGRLIAGQALLGPIRVKTRIAAGMDPAESLRIGRDQTIAAAQGHVLAGGRELVAATVRQDTRALGWVRVCSAGACAFCQMLASRGPTYKTERGASFEAHGGCNCSAEPLYSADPAAWPPRSAILADEWQTVTKGLSGNDARIAWRRHVEGRAGELDADGIARRDAGRRDSESAKVTEPTRTKAGRGRDLSTVPDGTVAKGRGKTLKRAADPNDPAVKAARQEAELGALRGTVAKLEARAAAGEDVAKALEWQRQRITALEAVVTPEANARAATRAAEAAATAGDRVAAEAARATRLDDAAAASAKRTEAAIADAERATLRADEARRVEAEEAHLAAQEAKAAAGAELDEQGHPWRLTVDYLEGLDDTELDAFVDYCAEGIGTDNPRELLRWEELEAYLEYRDAYDGIVAQAGNVADAVIDRELAELLATKGRAGLTHRADEAAVVAERAATSAGKPTRRQVQEDYAVLVEELYLKAEDATNGFMVNAKGAARGITGKSLLTGDVRRVYRYASPELLEFFESTPRVQWSTYYAERTGSTAFDGIVGRQRRLNEGINRDRTALDLVTNREA